MNQHIIMEQDSVTTVEEYSELDFEHVEISTLDAEQPTYTAVCDDCGTVHTVHAGIWSCTVCGAVNHQDIEV